jgi:hypothetical protein
MQLLESLILSGRIIDIALAVMLAELLVLIALKKRGSLVFDVPGAVSNLGAGGSLALGIKAVLTGGSYLTIAACLVFSLMFHSIDTIRRVRRTAG